MTRHDNVISAKLKECPFCGEPIKKCRGPLGVSMYFCNNQNCHAIVSFGGSKYVGPGVSEAWQPDENWNRRTGEKEVQS